MSQDFMDPELFSDFIIEAKEHLETIEPNLLELEKAPDNLSLLNEIFRPMHSLKGASGFLGLNKMNGLAHKAENILDELRKGTMSVNSEIMDIILATTDVLRQMIDNLEVSSTEGDIDTAPLIETLDALLAGEPHAPLAHTHQEHQEVELAEITEQVDTLAAEGQASAPANEMTTTEEDPEGLEKVAGNVEEWIENLTNGAPYGLTAFGEGHLKDFIEEARENIGSLLDGLLELEKHPEGQTELVNDLFRYFHNLKGNSGIIGFNELNSLTHEAETLLNAVRKDEYTVTSKLVDLLLLAVDVLEALIFRIDPGTGQVTPFDTHEILDKLRQAVAGGAVELPASLVAASAPVAAQAPATAEAAPAAQGAHEEHSRTVEQIAIFKNTIQQQVALIDEAIAGLKVDGENKEFPDALFRCLTMIQNSCGFMKLEEIKVYTERTAGIVDKGRDSGLDFSMLGDLLEQECAIIRDMTYDAIKVMEAAHAAPVHTEPAPQEAAKTPAPAAKEVKKSEAAQTAANASQAPQEAAQAKPAATAPKAAATPAPAVNKPAAPAANKSAAPAAGKPEESTSKSSSTIRVDHEKLDHLMNLIGELIINRNRYSMLARQLEENQNIDISLIAQNLSETTYAMARISDDLQDTIMKVRMVPVASVFSRFPRLVRDLSRKSAKDVDLIMEGEETELDKSVVEVIGDPLVHLIRNSVDHGIEPDDIRKERGKDPKGKVWLRAYYKGNSVAIEIEDDGKGIDPDKMREVAIRKGVITADEAKLLDDREAMELIFAPGFSSAEVITDISGRGVGMDVVRTNIKNLKGSIAIASEIGKGTKFTLSLPLTLAIIDALMVNVADEMYAIPLDAVSETTKIEAHRLTDVKGRKAVTLRGEVLGIVSLAELLGLPCNMANQEMLSVVVIQDNERRLGLVVDRLHERQEIVIKPLGSYLGDLKGISGATIMGDGSVILILDPHEIYTLATSKA